jgi:hypothetical protein
VGIAAWQVMSTMARWLGTDNLTLKASDMTWCAIGIRYAMR